MYVNFSRSVDCAIDTSQKLNLTKPLFYGTMDMMEGGVKFVLRQKCVNINLTKATAGLVYIYNCAYLLSTKRFVKFMLNLC